MQVQQAIPPQPKGLGPAWLPRSAIPLLALDLAAWVFAMLAANMLRYGQWAPHHQPGATLLIAIGVQLVLGLGVGLYRGKWAVGRFEEVAALTSVVLLVGTTAAVLNLRYGRMPRTVPMIATALALVAMLAARYAYRSSIRRTRRPTAATAQRMLVFGAGSGAQILLPQLMTDPASPYRPVALLDDFPGLRSRSIHGVGVEGTRHDIASVARRFDAKVLLIAIPSASSQVVRDITELGHAAGLEVKALPRVADLVGSLAVTDIRAITEADLLGRRVTDLDLDVIASYVAGRRVLVTGAGGSIGSELCRQLMKFAPASLTMLDRDESALHGVQLSIGGKALLDGDDTVLADLRDRGAVSAAFERIRPQVVFHAAALKHLPMLERFPGEAWKTNVLGTQNVIDAARRVGVKHFINISTDKAANPISALGWSKRITADHGCWPRWHLRIGAVRQRARFAWVGARVIP
jgi:FlaA1/EpsC-like NDP-sugar epimerase